MSDFYSLAERLGFSFCRFLFKRKHAGCLITAWHLTVFSDQSDTFSVLFFFVCWPSRRAATRKKHTLLSFSSSLSKAVFRHSFQHQIPRVLCSFFPFHLCLFFSFLFLGITQSASSLPSELNSRKNTFRCQTCQTPNLIAAPPHTLLLSTPPLHFFTVLRISSAGCTEALCFFLPLGLCRYIFLYSFRMCSTVNYQLYVILEEKRRARGKQQSHQSPWLHNSCQPYSNKMYHIVNHREANVCVCVCLCVCTDNSEVIN